MDRRHFLQSATVAAGAMAANAASAQSDNVRGAVMNEAAGKELRAPQARRFVEQRWLIDNIIRANGIDWDQPRSIYLSAPCGPEATADFAAIRLRVQKFADASPAFEATAKRREAKARAAETAGELVTARENLFMAAVHWGAAQWPIDENNEQNLGYNERKRACYTSYAGLADHRVEAAWIPFRGQALPAWLHLPLGYSSGRIPAVISIP